MAVMERVLGVGDVGDEEDGWRSKNTPSTSWGGYWRSTEGSPAWDLAGSDGVAPVGAEDGCKKLQGVSSSHAGGQNLKSIRASR